MKKRNKTSIQFHAAGLALACVALLACFVACKEEPTPSNDKNIISFKIGDAVGAINDRKDAISVVVPEGTDLSSLTPEIRISGGASVSPGAGEAVNFSNPTTYLVTAENGSTRSYVVTVTATERTESPLSLTFGLPQNGNELEIYGIPADGVKLSVGERTNLPKAIVLSAGAASNRVYSSINWYIDNTQYSITGVYDPNIIIINASDYTFTQPHTITLEVVKDGVSYSRTITFTVER